MIDKNFDGFGEPRHLFSEAKDEGIIFLDKGNYEFTLRNGAFSRVCASQFTPSKGGWAFQTLQAMSIILPLPIMFTLPLRMVPLLELWTIQIQSEEQVALPSLGYSSGEATGTLFWPYS